MTSGVRITFSRGFPALFAEALKNLCYVKKIPFTRVQHPNMGIDRKTGEDRQKRLFELTAQTSLPVMWVNNERVRSNWTEQLALCERIGTGPKLVPDDMTERATMFGLCALILAEDGLVWNSRIQGKSPLGMKYGYTPEKSKAAPGKMAQIITILCDRLEAQKKVGSKYLIGNSITAADIYLATMSYNLVVPDENFLPRTKQTRMINRMFGNLQPVVKAALKPIMVEHRDYIIKKYCEFPVNNGGDPVE